MVKQGKIKIHSSNGLSLRNGPSPLGDIIKKLPNEAEYTVGDIVKDGHLVWGKLEEEDGWIVLENLREGILYVDSIKPTPKPKKTRKLRAVVPPVPLEVEPELEAPVFEATETAEEEK